MAETSSLLNCRTGHSVPGVRIPPPPQKTPLICSEAFFCVSTICCADRTYLPAFLKRSFWKPFSITVLMQVLVLRKPLNMVASAL